MRVQNILYLCIATLLNIFMVDASGEFDCDSILQTASERSAFDIVKKAFNEGQHFDIKCLENTCQKHYFKISEFLIEDYYSKNDIDTLEVIDRQMALLKKSQSELYKGLAKADTDLIIIKPAFKWAQSLENVFIETKFSHRMDAPACSEVIDQKIKISESHLNLTAKCRRGDDTLLYTLYLNLFDKIDTKESTWEKQSMGTIYINLKKKISPNRWTKLNLNNDNEDKPGKAYLWRDIHEKYEKSLEDYAKQFREEEDDYDDFDYFVARETGVHLPEKPMKFGKTTTIETKDVTDQIKAVDVTEEMRAKFDSQAFRDQMLSGNYGPGSQYRYDDYDEFDEEEYDHMEREIPDDL